MSEEDYDGLIETVHLLNSPANAARLLRAIADADRDMLTNARSPWPSRAERAR
jgi:antitoxin YefM